MLSVNIPVFNIDVRPLVKELVLQAEKLNVELEIRVYDDGSAEQIKLFNREIAQYKSVVYRELANNLGRAAIRNLMGNESEFKYLLFIDADSLPVNDDYLKKYLEICSENLVVCGGTAYRKEKPETEGELLRWYYGTHREAISAERRNNSKGFIITSNNFLIEKRILDSIGFRENIGVYGHEDTLLGFDLIKNGVRIQHINNPLLHTGLENATVFLEKTRQALESLYKINTEIIPGEEGFSGQVNFLKKYSAITKFVPLFFIRMFFRVFQRLIEFSLKSRFPIILFFDLYKLGYYSTLPQKKIIR